MIEIAIAIAIAIIIGSFLIGVGIEQGLRAIASAINPDYDE